MAEIGLAVAQTLFAALNCSELKEICAIWGYKNKLEDLNKTVNTIKRVLVDVESKVLTNEAQGYIDELKDTLYEADDLFDEFVTLLELNKLQKSPTKQSEFFQKVRCFFSSDKNQVSHAYRMFHNVKNIQKKLNVIVDNHQKISLGVDYESVSMRRQETCSFVDVKGIIGRDDDKNAIIDRLMDSKDQRVHFLTIVGVGGIGKTTLAQLVYNDEKLKQEFGDSIFWVCVSDQDKAQFDVKAILCKILESVLHKKSFDSCSLDIVQKHFQNNLRGKKYFLVLDDVWNEDREKWVGLENLLMLGQGGSRVLVTTRSEMTAKVIGDGWTYMLQGLSLDRSWNLFEMTAFDKESNLQCVNYIEMVEIGKAIVEKCSNVPLAIKVVGSLLFRQDISKWRSFAKSGLAKIDNGDNKVMSVLKLSYYNLRFSLKSCFSYCAVFPKDFEIKKALLINLWMAQGYIEPLNGGESIEDAAEEHFQILLRRCFFQDVKKNEYDEIESVKIHDLMHNVAQEVGGGEAQALSSVDNTLGDRTRHVNMFFETCFESFSNWSKLRTFLTPDLARHYKEILKDAKAGNWKSLRVLEAKNLKRGSLLHSIGKLQHLRYLDLSNGHFDELPDSITKLHNLQTLILYDCRKLRQLPHDFSKLVKLRRLILEGCLELTSMPLGLDKLKDLGALTRLVGRIHIEFDENYRNVEEVMEDMSGRYLTTIPGLKEVTIMGRKCVEAEAIDLEADEVLLEKLEPHPNLKKLELRLYRGRTIPWWISSLSSLQSLIISRCYLIESLPEGIQTLTSLRILKIEDCCRRLKERCREPDGQDWPKIQHIPNLHISAEYESESEPELESEPEPDPGTEPECEYDSDYLSGR